MVGHQFVLFVALGFPTH